MLLACWKCGAGLREVPRPLSRLSRCPECFSDLYCCRMCRKFAPKYLSKCSDERADPPQNKQGANFCDWFTPDPDAYSGHEKSAEDLAKENLKTLFGTAGDVPPNVPGDGVGDGEGDGDGEAVTDKRTASERALEEARKLFGPKKQ